MRLRRLIPIAMVVAGLIAEVTSAQDPAKEQAVAFDPPVRLEAGKEFIDTGKYTAHAGPLAVDIDADDKLDLLVGNFQGHIQVYRNVDSRTNPEYEAQGLLEAAGATVKIPNW